MCASAERLSKIATIMKRNTTAVVYTDNSYKLLPRSQGQGRGQSSFPDFKKLEYN